MARVFQAERGISVVFDCTPSWFASSASHELVGKAVAAALKIGFVQEITCSWTARKIFVQVLVPHDTTLEVLRARRDEVIKELVKIGAE